MRCRTACVPASDRGERPRVVSGGAGYSVGITEDEVQPAVSPPADVKADMLLRLFLMRGNR